MATKTEKLTKKIYLKQHRNFIKTTSYKRFLNVFSNPKNFGLTKKNFKDKNVLDLGCGSTGYLQKAMEKLDCKSVTCSDLGNQYIKDLKKFEKKNINKKNFLIYKSQNVRSLTFKDNSFDIVFLNGVIMHLSNITQVNKCLKEAQRVTKKKGFIWIYAGNDNRDGIVDHYLLPSLRIAYKKNILFKRFVDNLNEKNFFKIILNIYDKVLSKSDFKKASKFLKEYITLDTITFWQNALQVPHQINTKINYKTLKKALNKCKIKRTKPLLFKRYDIRKFLQPFYSNDNKISNIFYNKHLHILARKNL
jgi:ubiquinone/menaquinone biosynthesis C-methylase UbiE